jgi:hypothetical protein
MEQEAAAVFNDHFLSKVEKLRMGMKTNLYPLHHTREMAGKLGVSPSSFGIRQVSAEQVRKAILDSKKSSAVDRNGISPKMLKMCGEAVVESLRQVINLSIGESTVPKSWNYARVVPVFKKKLRTDKNNYRPKSILPAGSKILEEIVRNQLARSLKKWNVLPKEQHGFQKSRSTSMAAHCAIHEWRSLLSTGKTVAMAMFDLSAAFDLVEADLLVEKLRIYGAEEMTCQWLKSYMTGQIQLVQVGNYKSEEPTGIAPRRWSESIAVCSLHK